MPPLDPAKGGAKHGQTSHDTDGSVGPQTTAALHAELAAPWLTINEARALRGLHISITCGTNQ